MYALPRDWHRGFSARLQLAAQSAHRIRYFPHFVQIFANQLSDNEIVDKQLSGQWPLKNVNGSSQKQYKFKTKTHTK